jgi:hypothetical protein
MGNQSGVRGVSPAARRVVLIILILHPVLGRLS